MTIKEKISVKVKGYERSDGRKQFNHISWGVPVSPTIHLDSVMITSAIDAKDKWDVSVVGLPGAFLST